MARNGSGVYSLPVNSWYPAVNGVNATAADWNSLISDLASAMTGSLAADGQTPLSGNLNAATYKITNLGAATTSTDAMQWGQLQNLTTYMNFARATVAATATTTPLWAAVNVQDWTGTPAITDFPAATQAGAMRVVYPATGTIFTNAGNISVQGNANYTTEAGDRITIEAVTTTTFRVWVDKKDGEAVVIPQQSPGITGGSKNLIIVNNSTTPNSQVDVDADEIIVRNAISGASQMIRSVNLTLNIATSGIGGLSAGTEANSTWYYLWVGVSGSTINGWFDPSATSPTIPSGYDSCAMVGAVFNDSSGNFLPMRQRGKIARLNLPVLDLNDTTPATVKTSFTTSAPPNTYGNFFASGSSNNGIVTMWFSEPLDVDTAPAITSPFTFRFGSSSAGDSSAASTSFTLFVDGSSQISYRSDDGAVASFTVITSGWEFP